MRTEILVAGFACLSLIAVAQSNQTSSQTSKAAKVAREAGSGQATGKTSAHDDWHQQSAASAGQAATVRESPTKASTGLRESPTKASTGLQESPSKASDGLRESPTKASTGLRESPTKASTGLRESPTKASTGQTSQVAAGDVNGDGSADKTAGDSFQSDVKTPRDSATGMATGKRQHQPPPIKNYGSSEGREGSTPSVSEVVVTKRSDKAKIVPADLDRGGQSDASAGSGKGNEQNAATKPASDVKTPRDVSTGMASGKRQHGVIRIQKEVGPTSPKQ